MTGGEATSTTEILKNLHDKKWTVLENGKLPGYSKYREGVGLATVDNNVFAFGNSKKEFQQKNWQI